MAPSKPDGQVCQQQKPKTAVKSATTQPDQPTTWILSITLIGITWTWWMLQDGRHNDEIWCSLLSCRLLPSDPTLHVHFHLSDLYQAIHKTRMFVYRGQLFRPPAHNNTVYQHICISLSEHPVIDSKLIVLIHPNCFLFWNAKVFCFKGNNKSSCSRSWNCHSSVTWLKTKISLSLTSDLFGEEMERNTKIKNSASFCWIGSYCPSTLRLSSH